MKIKSVKRITLDDPVSVYDITVPETENFTLAAGPVVHNSKDVADAVCGVASYLLTRRSAWTTQPTFRGDSGLLLHGSRTGIGTVQLARLTDEEIGKTGGRHRITERKTSKRIASRRGKSA